MLMLLLTQPLKKITIINEKERFVYLSFFFVIPHLYLNVYNKYLFMIEIKNMNNSFVYDTNNRKRVIPKNKLKMVGEGDSLTINGDKLNINDVNAKGNANDIIQDINNDTIEKKTVLSFEFSGDSVTFDINGTSYTATTSPFTIELAVLGVDADNVTSMMDMFNGATNMTKVNQIPYCPNMTNCVRLFRNCENVTSIDLSTLNTNGIFSTKDMFRVCQSLTSLDLSNFNTSKVRNMGGMFYKCSSLTSLDLSNFNTSKVTYMGQIFRLCSALTTINVSNWDISNVTNMAYMFFGCTSLTKLILGDVTQEQYDWWHARLTDASIQDNVTIEYKLI